MRRFICALCLPLTLLGAALVIHPLTASAQGQPRDRIAYGEDAHVAPGERVDNAVSFGGDTVVEGEVLGDAASFGGSVIQRGDGVVRGSVTSLGGANVSDARAETGAEGPLATTLDWLATTARGAVAHLLVFLLGLLLLGVARERLRAMQAAMVRDGLKTAGAGLLGYVAAVVAIVLFALTILGIPVAVVVALALPLATYVGLAAAATVIGAALPLPATLPWAKSPAPLGTNAREVLQLAAGVVVLFVASLVPMAGSVVTAAAACLGFGALLRTRFSTTPPSVPDGAPDAGPSPAVV